MVPDPPEVLERFNAQLGLVDMLARQLARSLGGRCSVERDDLISAGRVGLLNAARRFDPAQGVTFSHFASFRVRGAMLDAVRENSTIPRYDYYRLKALTVADQFSDGDWHRVHVGAIVPAAMSEGSAERSLDEHLQAMVDAAAISLIVDGSGEVTSDGIAVAGDNPEEAYSRAEQMARIESELDAMVDERVLTASEREIVQRHYFGGQSITQIATELNFSKAWVSEQHTRAISRLSERLRESDLP